MVAPSAPAKDDAGGVPAGNVRDQAEEGRRAANDSDHLSEGEATEAETETAEGR